ncbi:hypothetical protein EMPS_11250 [Entomortierella parvispora]|uniref:BHLH domain-containing protein n=1 Tax=Entomortierella parvispora TaxID=205924 RepID=A0A9P3HLP4_9FUNG|nr:hypothetical protein EMPS_11250 [Entomortierella parvispora]
MALPSLLSDHEQRAFSDFLTQLNHDEQNHASRVSNGAPAVSSGGPHPLIDPSLSQEQLQQHLYLRHLQQQQQQQQQQHSSATQDNGHGGVFGGPFPTSGSSLAPAPSLEQQQREWIHHLSSNPLLAPGGVIDPHAMSQAFLQNPQLMAQANAISQAMMIAQHQQQMLQHQQQQQQQREQEQRQQHQQQHYQISDGPHDRQQHQPHHQHQQIHHQQSSYHASATSSEVPSQFPGQDQHPSPPQEYQLPHSHRPQVPSLSSPNLNLTRSGPKEKSTPHNGYANDPTSAPQMTGHNNNNNGHGQLNDAALHSFNRTFDNDYGNESDPSPPPSKKAARRKESTATSSPYDSPKAKSTHRSSRDGHDTNRAVGSRKSSSASSFPVQSGGMNGYKRESLDESGFLNHQHIRQNSAGQNSDDESGEQERSTSPQTKAQGGSSKPSGKKAPHELLTDAEKKANHIASEQKRRQNIRVGFDCLVEIVPTLSECHRSEALILQKSVDYIHRLLSQKNELESKVRYLQANLGEPNEQFLDQSDYSDTEMN